MDPTGKSSTYHPYGLPAIKKWRGQDAKRKKKKYLANRSFMLTEEQTPQGPKASINPWNKR